MKQTVAEAHRPPGSPAAFCKPLNLLLHAAACLSAMDLMELYKAIVYISICLQESQELGDKQQAFFSFFSLSQMVIHEEQG